MAQGVTASNNEWQWVTENDNGWQGVTKRDATSKKGTVYFKEWIIAILSIAKIYSLLQGMDGWY